MTHPAAAALRQVVTERGLRPGTFLENQAALFLHRAGLRPEQQYQAGRYRLDFAWPDLKVALEVDGWHHRSPEGAAKDRQRDSWLRSQDWVVFRVDDEHGEDALLEQLVRVCRIVHDGAGGPPPKRPSSKARKASDGAA